MLNHDTIYVILFAIPIYQLLFYTVQLLSFKRKNPSKKYLGLLLLSMTAFLVMNAVLHFGYYDLFAWLFFAYLPLLLAVAPSFYLYILSITNENNEVDQRQILFTMAPSIVILLASVILAILYDRPALENFFSQDLLRTGGSEGQAPGFLMVVWVSSVLLVFTQIILIIVRVSRIIQVETEKMRIQPSHLAYLEWRWILGISLGVLVFLVINSLVNLFLPTDNLGIALVFNILMLISGGIAGYLGMKQDNLLNQVSTMRKPDLLNKEPGISPAEETLPGSADEQEFISQEESDSIQKALIKLMETEKIYLRQDFSMHDLCSKLNVSRRKMSYVLNVGMGKNFYGLVNEYRVKEAESLLLDQETLQLKIEAVGEMVGFQSKSSFNACFKKYTGMTPTEYRNRQNIS